MVEHLSDDELRNLSRGGHDYRKVYAAFKAATEHVGQPTVILAHTIKGWTLGPDFEARNATHQMKKLTVAELKEFRDRLYLEIPDSALEAELPPYYHPGENSDEITVHEGAPGRAGRLPAPAGRPRPAADAARATRSTTSCKPRLRQAGGGHHDGLRPAAQGPDEGPGDRRPVRADHPGRGAHVRHGLAVPDARRSTRRTGRPTRRWTATCCCPTRSPSAGQILHEGISEAGAMGSVIAAGTSYATHGTPMIPVYVFYSMFGWQRTGDQMWALGDQLGRGFLLGATAGRTTLTGEGLQHNDGHSVLLASVSPACVAYDAAWAYELAYIVQGRAAPDVRPDRRAPGRRGHLLLPDRSTTSRTCRPAEPADYPGGSGRAGAGRSCAACTGTPRARGRSGREAGQRRTAAERHVPAADSRAKRLRPAPGPDPGLRRGAALGAGARSGCWPRTGGWPPRCGRRRPGPSCAATRWPARSGTCCTPTRSTGCRT